MTHDEAKRLADMIGSPITRRDITEREYDAIAGILRKHKLPAKPPKLDDRDREATRVQRAQHAAAYVVLEWQKDYRERHNCERVPGTETDTMLDDAINTAARWFHIDPTWMSKLAIRIIMKNGPSLRHPRPALRVSYT